MSDHDGMPGFAHNLGDGTEEYPQPIAENDAGRKNPLGIPSKKNPPWWPTAEQKRHADAGCSHPDECRVKGAPMTLAEEREIRAAFERDKWAGEWNSLPTAIDRLLATRVTPPDALLCPGDGCPGCFHCTSTNQGDDSDRATEPGRLVEPSNTASISRMEGATGAVGAPSPDAEVGAADGRVGRSRAREVARVLPPGEKDRS